MTKADIVSEISKSTGIDKQTVLASVESFMDIVKGSLAQGENVYLRGFGSFVIKKRAQKTARNRESFVNLSNKIKLIELYLLFN